MGELKYKNANPLTAFAEGLGSLIEKGQDIYANVKDVLEDKRIEYASLSLSAIKILISSDPVLATCQFALKRQRMMFPLRKKGYTIDYSNPFHEPCPTHGCKTYHVKETSLLVWCPLCMDFLEVYG